jgi:hypothetical protein
LRYKNIFNQGKTAMNNKPLNVLLAAICLAACGNVVAADGLTINVGTDYSSGKYGGTDRTTVVSVPVSAKYATGPVTFRLSTSWLSVSGTGVVIPSGIGGIGSSGGVTGSSGSGGSVGVFGCAADNRSGARKPEDNGPCAATVVAGGGAGAAAVRRTEQGFGDVVAAVVYNAVNKNGLTLDVTGKVKFATASDTKGLGSGKNDYAFQVEAEQAIGKGYLNGGIGYKWLGDPVGVSLNNVVYGSIGGGFKLSADTTIGVSYDTASASRSGGTKPQELSFYASQRLNKNIKINANIYKGLSDGSPDWGAGIGLGYTF